MVTHGRRRQRATRNVGLDRFVLWRWKGLSVSGPDVLGSQCRIFAHDTLSVYNFPLAAIYALKLVMIPSFKLSEPEGQEVEVL